MALTKVLVDYIILAFVFFSLSRTQSLF